MVFKNVLLSKEESIKLAEYFDEKYGSNGGFTGIWSTWSGITINENQTIFVAKNRVNRDKPYQSWFYYFWNGYLFDIQVNEIWGDDDLEAWDLDYISFYPVRHCGFGIQIPNELVKNKEQILQDLKSAMIIYGRYGNGVKGFEKLDPPITNIEIRVEGKVY